MYDTGFGPFSRIQKPWKVIDHLKIKWDKLKDLQVWRTIFPLFTSPPSLSKPERNTSVSHQSFHVFPPSHLMFIWNVHLFGLLKCLTLNEQYSGGCRFRVSQASFPLLHCLLFGICKLQMAYQALDQLFSSPIICSPPRWRKVRWSFCVRKTFLEFRSKAVLQNSPQNWSRSRLNFQNFWDLDLKTSTSPWILTNPFISSL